MSIEQFTIPQMNLIRHFKHVLLLNVLFCDDKLRTRQISLVSVLPSWLGSEQFVCFPCLWSTENNCEFLQQCVLKAKCSPISHNWLIHMEYNGKGCWDQWKFSLPGLAILDSSKVCLSCLGFLTRPQRILALFSKIPSTCFFTCYYLLINKGTQGPTKWIIALGTFWSICSETK